MTEEILYALSDISASLSVFRQSTTSWEELTQTTCDRAQSRTRWDSETRLLIEEEDSSKPQWGNWKVTKVHQGVEDKTKAVLLAASITQTWMKRHQAIEDLGSSTVESELGYNPLEAF